MKSFGSTYDWIYYVTLYLYLVYKIKNNNK